jgi:hypothetical protein
MRGDLSSLQAGAEVGNPLAIAALSKAPIIEFPWMWWAFGELSTERNVGMAAGPIPYSAIARMADEFNLVGHERHLLTYVIRGLDQHYLELNRKRSEAQSRRRPR